jgi:DNA-binding response OmpR family regulator
MVKILLVEDDSDMAATINKWLTSEQHVVETVHNGREGFERLEVCQYDLIILDWQLPEMSGLDICKQFRARQGVTPIIMLTGKSTVADKTSGLDSGADDYLTKPFSMTELSARLRALLRRPPVSTSNVLHVGNLVVDPIKHTVTRNNVRVYLLPKEFALLEFLMRHPEEVFSVEALLQRVWHSDSDASIDAIRTCVKRLRDKIDPGSENSVIETIPRVGYKLRSDV